MFLSSSGLVKDWEICKICQNTYTRKDPVAQLDPLLTDGTRQKYIVQVLLLESSAGKVRRTEELQTRLNTMSATPFWKAHQYLLRAVELGCLFTKTTSTVSCSRFCCSCNWKGSGIQSYLLTKNHVYYIEQKSQNFRLLSKLSLLYFFFLSKLKITGLAPVLFCSLFPFQAWQA